MGLPYPYAGLNVLSNKCYTDSYVAGWWDTDTPETPAVKISLIHSEVSEALEFFRKGGMDHHLPHRPGIEVELADALIRIFDLAGKLNLDLGGAVMEKLEYNRNRADHKRENRAKEGGKKI